MSFWGVVFVVLVLMWLFGGLYAADKNGLAPLAAGALIPWCRVAILGRVVLGSGGR